uniref:Uncharacterized protein n=1 Tax=Siphoviridae sp. ct2u94 TaxID=2826277 RepID=A0A8S5QVE1_9CAUD|nr:MAG TPA: hypothetical protein [Siphoviridae sp. ct2u94]
MQHEYAFHPQRANRPAWTDNYPRPTKVTITRRIYECA